MTPEQGKRYRFRLPFKRAIEATFVEVVNSPSMGKMLHIQTTDGRHKFLPEAETRIEVPK